MIRNQWYVILDSREVGLKPRRFRRMGESLVLWRDREGKVSCLVDRCCHRGAALSAGKLKDGLLQCPFHGLEYDSDGRCACIPANSRLAPVPDRYRVPAYPVYEDHGWIWIWWGDTDDRRRIDAGTGYTGDEVSILSYNARISPPKSVPAYFTDIDEHFSASTVKDHWNTHYSRVLENQLDVVHLPFVHHNTIGRGNRTVVDGPGVEWVDERMFYTYVFNRVDDGTPPRTPGEMPVPPDDRDFKLELIMPNLWENRIAPKLRLVAAFVPVDGDHTVLYLRTYQRTVGIPLFRGLVHWIMGRSNLFIAHQDRRVVQTQVPKRSALKGGEQLIQGDLPIVEYRKKRQEMLEAAGSPGD